SFRAAADEPGHPGARLPGRSVGARSLPQLAEVVERIRDVADPLLILRELRPQIDRLPRDPKKGIQYKDDDAAWAVWKAFSEGGKTRSRPLRTDLCGPLDRWLATRLVRLFPVVVELYEKVKVRHRKLDQLDLLIKLRDLVTRDRAVRAQFQHLFDHVFVDE